MTFVKICGITNLEDALCSVKFGADALGFNFYERSPRYISPQHANEIINKLPQHILKVGVFVNETLEKIIGIVETAGLNTIQLHGDESDKFVKELKTNTNCEIIKAFRVSPAFDATNVLQYEADAILLDAYHPENYGGTGEVFDWRIVKKVQETFPRIYLAGGLSPDNVGHAIFEIKPFAVDACSLLENAKGKKDKVKLTNFIGNVLFSRQILSSNEDLLFHLKLFRYRPNSYLIPQKSITQVCTFIFGYLTALPKSQFEETQAFLKKFDKFEGIERGLFSHSIYSYADHFLSKCDRNEGRAFDLFYSTLEEFLLDEENSGKI